jgi:hypothetical protein
MARSNKKKGSKAAAAKAGVSNSKRALNKADQKANKAARKATRKAEQLRRRQRRDGDGGHAYVPHPTTLRRAVCAECGSLTPPLGDRKVKWYNHLRRMYRTALNLQCLVTHVSHSSYAMLQEWASLYGIVSNTASYHVTLAEGFPPTIYDPTILGDIQTALVQDPRVRIHRVVAVEGTRRTTTTTATTTWTTTTKTNARRRRQPRRRRRRRPSRR